MAKKASIYGGLTLLVLVALVAGGYSVVKRRSEQYCGFCARHISAQARVVAEVGGEKRTVCCAHCAVTEGKQQHKEVRLIEVTDYNTGRKLDPAKAWYVDGSRVMACEHEAHHMDESKRMEHPTFDRCAPGTFAFRTRDEAAAFAAKHGGVINDLGAMLKGVEQ